MNFMYDCVSFSTVSRRSGRRVAALRFPVRHLRQGEGRRDHSNQARTWEAGAGGKDRALESKRKTEEESVNPRLSPGGTPGGIGMFLFGVALAIAGGYLIMNQVQVTSGYWHWWGTNTFGLTLLPLVIGTGLLFFNGKSIIGWLLAGGGAVIIFVGILSNLQIYFQQTSLFNTILMLTLFAAGLGLMARALKHS
jgi:uncharacterized protein